VHSILLIALWGTTAKNKKARSRTVEPRRYRCSNRLFLMPSECEYREKTDSSD
jgi:hypothetical protein